MGRLRLHEQSASRWSSRKEPMPREDQSLAGDRAQVLMALFEPLKPVMLNPKLPY